MRRKILTMKVEKGSLFFLRIAAMSLTLVVLFASSLWAVSNSSLQELPAKVKVQGKVVDEAGEPLPGATILEKGTENGTITNVKGEFSMSVSEDAVLLISFVGYMTQDISITGRSYIDVSMQLDVENLEEVVVIGYGTQKKETLTGSIVSAEGADIQKAPETNIANTLIGRLPGLITNNRGGEPGYENTEILIRGRSTFGDNSPLVVVDGVANRAGGLSNIDANDIESITVLKDASAAIYGAQAANGVILVTTKRGELGKTTVRLSSNFAFRQPTVLPDMLNSADYAVALNEIETEIYGRSPLYSDEQIELFRNGSDPTNYPNVDWMDKTLRSYSPQMQHNLSINGGTEKVNYFISTGYQYTDNYYENSASDYEQYNVRSNIDVHLNDNLKLFTNISLRKEDRNSPHYGSEDIWRYLVKGDPRVNIVWPENGLPVLASQDNFNPQTAVDGTMGYQKNNNNIINLDLGFDLDMSFITDGLSFDGGVFIDRTDGMYKHFEKAFYLYGYNANTDEYYSKKYGPNNASLNENMNRFLGVTSRAKLNYKVIVNEDHNFSTFVAYEQYESKYDYLWAKRQDFVSTEVDEIFAGDSETALNDGYASETGRVNYFGRADYSYKEKYLVQFNWRYDGSQNFPKDNRFGFFPGASVGWQLSEEGFWKEKVPFIGYFKLKGSWGQMGNDKIDQYQYLTTYTFGLNATFGGDEPSSVPGVQQTRNANPNVKWEVATTVNIGLESKFLDYFSFNFDLFKTKREDILSNGSSYVPDYSGVSLPAENIAEAEVKGFEAELGYSRSFGKFSFMANGNFSYARSKILFFDEPVTTLQWQKETGKPIGSDWLIYKAIGIFRTQEDLDNYPHLSNAKMGDLIFADTDENGVIDGNDQIRLDKTNTPEIVYGINLGMQYGGWELSMLWQGATNVWQYQFFESGSIGNFTQDFFDHRWTEDNPNASYPRIYDRYVTSSSQSNTFWLQDATYLRLKNIQLAYTVPNKFLERLPLSQVRVYASASNLLTFTKLKDQDPESTAGGQGFAAWGTPQAKVINLGLNLTF